jgi:hypothetical protein
VSSVFPGNGKTFVETYKVEEIDDWVNFQAFKIVIKL